jgi:hypothetical protein
MASASPRAPSFIICDAPAPPSSAGWKRSLTVPFITNQSIIIKYLNLQDEQKKERNTERTWAYKLNHQKNKKQNSKGIHCNH